MWIDELLLYADTTPLVIRGNLFDIYEYSSRYLPLKPVLAQLLNPAAGGTPEIIQIGVDGHLGIEPSDLQSAMNDLDSQKPSLFDFGGDSPMYKMAHAVRALVQSRPANAPMRYVILDLSPCIAPNSQLSCDQSLFFHEVFEACRMKSRNCGLLILAPDEVMFPSWIQNAAVYRTISIPRPGFRERQSCCRVLFPKQSEEDINWCAAVTERFYLKQLRELHELGIKEQITDLRTLFRVYTHGVRDDQWLHRKDALRDCENDLKRRLKGQDRAVSHVSSVLRSVILGLSSATLASDKRRPSVLFLAGPTGTGKTETVKALADHVFGSSDHLIRIQGSELLEAHAGERLFGSPPGYIGYEAGGQLTNTVSRHPYSIVLFDEVEKMHPSVFDRILQILDEGVATDGKGQTVSFRDTIIIFCSNIGCYQRDENGKIMPLPNEIPYEDLKACVTAAIGSTFKPEFVGRLADIIVYDVIREDAAVQICDLMLSRVQNRVCDLYGITCMFDNSCHDFVLSRWDRARGARGIDAAIQQSIIRKLEKMLTESTEEMRGSTVQFTVNKGSIEAVVNCGEA